MQVDLWDISKMQKVRRLTGHCRRVSALSWNSHLLSTAGGNGVVLNRDVRVPEDSVAALHGHRAEVCGLKVLLPNTHFVQLSMWCCHDCRPLSKAL